MEPSFLSQHVWLPCVCFRACESSRKHTSATKPLRSVINPSLSALVFFLSPPQPPPNLRYVLAVVDVYPCAALLALSCGNKHGASFTPTAHRDTGSQKYRIEKNNSDQRLLFLLWKTFLLTDIRHS